MTLSRIHPDPSVLSIEPPHCPRCHNRMAPARIVSGPKGFDLRNFECANCDHFITLAVAADPGLPGTRGNKDVHGVRP